MWVGGTFLKVKRAQRARARVSSGSVSARESASLSQYNYCTVLVLVYLGAHVRRKTLQSALQRPSAPSTVVSTQSGLSAHRLTVTRVTFLIWRHRLTVSDPCSVRATAAQSLLTFPCLTLDTPTPTRLSGLRTPSLAPGRRSNIDVRCSDRRSLSRRRSVSLVSHSPLSPSCSPSHSSQRLMCRAPSHDRLTVSLLTTTLSALTHGPLTETDTPTANACLILYTIRGVTSRALIHAALAHYTNTTSSTVSL
jgi:hypothetical protein